MYEPRSHARHDRFPLDPGWRGLLVALLWAAAVPAALLAASYPLVAGALALAAGGALWAARHASDATAHEETAREGADTATHHRPAAHSMGD